MSFRINRRILLFSAALMAFGWNVQASEPTPGGTMVMIVNPEPSSLAQYASSAGNTPKIATQIYEGLVTYDWDLNPAPALAKSWDIAPDGKTITFHLQEGVTFHDGTPFTSADVQYSFMEVLKNVHPNAAVFLSKLTEVETPDEMTAIFHLSEPAPYLMRALDAFGAPIVSKALFEGTNPMENPTANKPIGTGPFKFVSWDRGQSLRLERNENYWKEGLPYLDGIVVRFIPDASTRTAALEAGEVHLAGHQAISFSDLELLKQNPDLEFTTKGYETSPALSFLELNTKRPPLDKKEVRQAMSYAIDRQFIADNVFYGNARPATGPLGTSFETTGIYEDQVRRYDVPDRLEIANKLLDDAGLPRGSDGKRFGLFMEVNPFGGQMLRQAEYLKQALGDIGIDVTLRSEDVPTWLRRVYTDYDYDISSPINTPGVDPIVGLDRIYTTAQIKKGAIFVNNMFYSNPELDQLLAEASVENAPEKRAEMYKEAQRILVEDAPAIWLNELEYVTVTNRKLHDHTTGPLGLNQAFERAWLER